MDGNLKSALETIMTRFLARNYDYLWLRTMLERASAAGTAGSTLITGSSHALYAIRESCWNSAFNCSMHSQDLYYDFQCARRVLNAKSPRGGGVSFSRCIIIMGYYVPWQDLSLSKKTRKTMITDVYYPIFGDAHHWDAVPRKDLCKKGHRGRESCATLLSRFHRLHRSADLWAVHRPVHRR